MRARRVHVDRPAADVYRIRLEIEGNAAPAFGFIAGQYVRVLHPSGLAIPFSLASAPERLPEIAIHFRPLPGAPEAAAMLDLVHHGETFDIDGPFGDVAVRGPTAAPLRLVAGGTGIAQCLAILEHLTHVGQRESVRLVWSVSSRDHLYALTDLERLKHTHAWFDFEAEVDGPEGTSAALAALRRDGGWPEPDIVLSGGPPFVYAICDALAAAGARHGRLHSDVFGYAPRPSGSGSDGKGAPPSSA